MKSLLQKLWAGSIRRQLMLGITLVHAVLMTLFVVDLIGRQSSFLHERAMAESRALVGALAANSTPWVLANDLVGMEEVLRSLVGFPELRYAMVLTPEGRVLAHTRPGVAGQYIADPVSLKLLIAPPTLQVLLRDPTAIDIAAPILLDGQAVGWARVGMGQAESRIELDRIIRQGIIFILAAIVVGALFALLMARSLTSGLYAVKSVADAFANGRRDLRAPEDRSDEVGRLAADFNHLLDIVNTDQAALQRALEALRQSNNEMEQFTYVASHDLRQPLRTVTSYLTLIDRALPPPVAPDIREYMDFARAGAKRMDGLIVSLLEYSRIGRISRPFAATPLADVIAVNLQDLAAAIKDAGAVVTVAAELPVIDGDYRELAQLFQNLLSNAIKYRHPDRPPVVEIGWRDSGTEWIVWVRDNGRGIDSKDYERAFVIFQRLVLQDQCEGVGIGLAVCRKIVDHHHGRIWIDSVPDQGSTFFVAFPHPAPDAPPTVNEPDGGAS